MIRLIFPVLQYHRLSISALPSTVGIIFFHRDPRNGIACHEGIAGEQRYNCTLSLTPELDGGRCTPRPVWTGAENIIPTGIRFPDRPSRSESLYRLSYPGPQSRNRSYNLQFVWIIEKSSSSSVICQTTGPKPIPKRLLHIVRSRASSFN